MKLTRELINYNEPYDAFLLSSITRFIKAENDLPTQILLPIKDYLDYARTGILNYSSGNAYYLDIPVVWVNEEGYSVFLVKGSIGGE